MAPKKQTHPAKTAPVQAAPAVDLEEELENQVSSLEDPAPAPAVVAAPAKRGRAPAKSTAAPAAAPAPAPTVAAVAAPAKRSRAPAKSAAPAAAPVVEAPAPTVAAPVKRGRAPAKAAAPAPTVAAAAPAKRSRAPAKAAAPAPAAPAKRAPRAAKVADQEAEDASSGSGTRTFKLVASTVSPAVDTSVLSDNGGRYCGRTPMQAAKKCFTQLSRKTASGKECEFTYTIQESTQGSDKKQHTYHGSRVKLAEPEMVERAGTTYPINFKNHVKAVKSSDGGNSD